MIALPKGYDHLETNVSNLLSEHPSYESNVFLIMRFAAGGALSLVDRTLRATLERHGLSALRADDRSYHPELWGNVCTYMLGCSKAIVVFEDIDVREFNPNVALELGFMLAHDKPCLILKEKRLPRPPTDMIGRLWREFDSFDIEGTLPPQILAWVLDIGWNPADRPSLPPALRALLKQAAAFHEVLQMLVDEFDMEAAFDEIAASSLRRVCMEAAGSGAVSQQDALLQALAEEDEGMIPLVRLRKAIADAYERGVLRPLGDQRLASELRILQARKGMKKVLDLDRRLMVRIETLCGYRDS
ncbi:MAG: hypothetical protein FJ291_27560 [Planctomycetes bacterium]|nr:hypothetical protein [Planctomycetota bacterium]